MLAFYSRLSQKKTHRGINMITDRILALIACAMTTALLAYEVWRWRKLK